MAQESNFVLVINADDFGYSGPRNKGIVEAFINGLVSSVSLLVNATSSMEAVELAKKFNIPMGLHLNLTEGLPVANKHYSSLVGNDGFFLGKFGFREAIERGTVDMNEVRHEIVAQFEWFKQYTGSVPTHTDGHQHIHVFPGIRNELVSVMVQNRVFMTRVPAELKLAGCIWIEKPRMAFYSSVVSDATESKVVFEASQVRFTDYFIGLSTMGNNMSGARIQQAFEAVLSHAAINHVGKSPVTCELMVHPGYRSVVGCGGCGQGPDEFACSSDREHELRVLLDQTLRNYFVKNGIRIMSFRDIANISF